MKQILPYIGPVIGLTGISLALYFHAQAVQERVPTFYVGEPRAVIVDARGPTSSDLQVLFQGNRVGSSVTAVTAYVWNAGKLPIRPTDILGDPIAIELPPGSEILEARVLKASRPVVRFSLGTVARKLKNSLPVSFDILERDDGAAIQLVYSGDPNASVNVTGTVVGAGAPKLLADDGKFAKSASPKERAQAGKFAAFAVLAMGGLAIVLGFVRWRRRVSTGRSVGPAALIAIVGLSYLCGGAYLLYRIHKAASPVPASIRVDT